MKAKFEQLLKEKNLTVGDINQKMKDNVSNYYNAVKELKELEGDANYNEDDINEVKSALTDLDNQICTYLNKIEQYKETGRKMHEARVAKKVIKAEGGNMPPKPVEQQQAAPPVVIEEPIKPEEHQQQEPEKKKGIGVGTVIRTILGVAAFAFLGISFTKGTFPFKRR